MEDYDAFVVFDTDNILDKNYFKEMNRTSSDGYEVITSYRNSKNFGDNWISSGYALWFLHEAQFFNDSGLRCNTNGKNKRVLVLKILI